MEAMKFYITTAKIKGVFEKPQIVKEGNSFERKLDFYALPLCTINKEYLIKEGDNFLSSIEAFKRHCSSFIHADISDDDKVAIIYCDNKIFAMARERNDKWIDFTDDFRIKTFSELGLDISSLTIAI